jgi:ABC transporter substrate binding protein
VRRVGVLLPATPDDARYQTWAGAFLQELAKSGWSVGRNVRIDTRWATANADAVHKQAAELVALAPDVILAPGASTVGPLLQVTRTLPIVFAIVADPVGAGFVDSLARPGGNATGFMSYEYGIGGKSAYRADRQGHRSPSLCPSLAPASLVELPSVRMRRVHGGLAWVTKHPTGKARHQEENHERDRRDSEVAVGAARSFPPFC